MFTRKSPLPSIPPEAYHTPALLRQALEDAISDWLTLCASVYEREKWWEPPYKGTPESALIGAAKVAGLRLLTCDGARVLPAGVSLESVILWCEVQQWICNQIEFAAGQLQRVFGHDAELRGETLIRLAAPLLRGEKSSAHRLAYIAALEYRSVSTAPAHPCGGAVLRVAWDCLRDLAQECRAPILVEPDIAEGAVVDLRVLRRHLDAVRNWCLGQVPATDSPPEVDDVVRRLGEQTMGLVIQCGSDLRWEREARAARALLKARYGSTDPSADMPLLDRLRGLFLRTHEIVRLGCGAPSSVLEEGVSDDPVQALLREKAASLRGLLGEVFGPGDDLPVPLLPAPAGCSAALGKAYGWASQLHAHLDKPPADSFLLLTLGSCAGGGELLSNAIAELEVMAESPGLAFPPDPPAHSGDAGQQQARRMTREEANDKAKKLAKADRFFVHRSLREWADAIGCSEGLVANLPLWLATMAETGRGKKDRVAPPKVVSLTGPLEAAVGDEDPELNRLMEEQQADMEPSPCEDDPPDTRPRKIRTRKRL